MVRILVGLSKFLNSKYQPIFKSFCCSCFFLTDGSFLEGIILKGQGHEGPGEFGRKGEATVLSMAISYSH